jgi:hypothetical protein
LPSKSSSRNQASKLAELGRLDVAGAPWCLRRRSDRRRDRPAADPEVVGCLHQEHDRLDNGALKPRR